MASTPAKTPLTFDAERRYRELTLESCDIIDLANLPEDRHVATRQLELRRLYVPLRVRIEVAPQTELGEDQLEAIERRREARRRGHAPWSLEDAQGRVPVGERLAKARRLVVLGDPGAGKSTMVRWIATAYLLRLKEDSDWNDLPDVATLPNEDWLPILVRCRDLDLSCSSLDDVLRHILRKSELKETESIALRSTLTSRISDGHALLLIDGLDEISDPIARAGFCQQIERICLANPKLPIVVTSRIVGYREMGYRMGRGFEHVTVADLSPEDKDDFARRWCTLTQPPERRDAATADLTKDIHSTERIERLTGNPMLLTTMALVKRKVGKLPRRRVDLYWEAVQVLLNWRSEVDQPIDYREALPQLEYVAYAMCQQGAQQLRDDEITSLFERMREEYPRIHTVKAHTTEAFLRLLERRTGILVQAGQVRHQGKTVPVYEFRHLTFQEYLAAQALVEGRFPGRDITRSIAQNVAPLAGRTESKPDPQGNQTTVVSEAWREALRLCVACCKDDEVDDVMRAILNPLPEEQPKLTVRSRAILAALCLADEPNVSEALALEVVEQLTRQFGLGLDAHDNDLIEAMEQLATSRWAKTVLSVLFQEYRSNVLTEEPRALNLFFCACSIAMASNVTEGIKLDDWLIACASKVRSGQEDVVFQSTAALTRIAEGRDAPFVARLISTSGIVEDLFSLLSQGPLVALAAAFTLTTWTEWEMEPKIWIPSVAQMQELLSIANAPSHNALVLTVLVFLLASQHCTEAIPFLIFTLDHRLPFVRQTAAEALGMIGDPRAAEPLLSHLNDMDNEGQLMSVESLAKLKYERPFQSVDETSVEPLLLLSSGPDIKIRRACVEALGKMRYVGAIPALVSRFGDEHESEDVRSAAAEALGRIGDPRVVDPLIRGLQHPSFSIQAAAANGLAMVGPPAIQPIIMLLGEGFNVSYHAVRAFTKIGGPAVEQLLELLGSDNGDKGQVAARALGEIKDIRAVEHLIARLDDPEFGMRWEAARALGAIGGSEAIAALRARLPSSEKATKTALLMASLPTMAETDRKLLTVNFDGSTPLNVEEEITERNVLDACANLGISTEIVRRQFEELAPQFSLKLSWHNPEIERRQE